MATVGPTLEKPEDLARAIEAGARWFRLPCGYRQRPHLQNSCDIRAAAKRLGVSVHLLLDLPSSRPRTGVMPELRLSKGTNVIFWDPEEAGETPVQNGDPQVPLPGLTALLAKLKAHHRLWFCDGRLSFVVNEFRNGTVLARLEKGNIPLKTSNAIFLPDSLSPFSVVTPADAELLDQFGGGGVWPDWVALSLIASPEDVEDGRREVQERLRGPVKIMAKFETAAAVKQVKDILAVADGAMVARGDLALAVGYVELPGVQEELVAAARQAGKPVVVATQCLEVFAETGLPHRGELSDLSLIARQQADAIMLGKETVYSARPIECIRFARKVLTHETRRFQRAAQRQTPSPARRKALAVAPGA